MNDLKEEQTPQKKRFNWGRLLFWVISLLIIIILIGVVSIPKIIEIRRKEILSSCPGNVRNLGIIITNYSTNNKGHYPQNLTVLEALDYVDKLPVCPISGKPYIYQINGWDSRDFTIMCPNPEKHNSSDGLRQTSRTYYATGPGVY